jgi:hypothetical protein
VNKQICSKVTKRSFVQFVRGSFSSVTVSPLELEGSCSSEKAKAEGIGVLQAVPVKPGTKLLGRESPGQHPASRERC